MHSSKLPNEMTELPAGRYEFKDNGIYIGEWYNDKAVGLGLITKDKSMGEFTGLWDNGCEKSGIFLWPNAPGAMYEGEWAHTKRHGYGIFTREDWMIIGRFKEDFISTGVKCKEHSLGKYEGEFENGLPTFGVETYADGGTYAGEYKNGIRNGLGIRTSIPYGEVFTFYPEVETKSKTRPRRDSLTSHRSAAEDNDEGKVSKDPTLIGEVTSKSGSTLMKMSKKFKCGFVLSGQKSDLLLHRLKQQQESKRKKEMKKGKGRWRSVGSMLTSKSNRDTLPNRRGFDGSFRSAHSAQTYNTLDSGITVDWPQEDSIEPEAVETFSGEWIQDVRQGFGVCERSDGVKYEGQWFNNLRHGYGVTHFPDSTMEAGRYQNGELVFLAGRKNPLLFIYSYHMNKMIENAVRKAREIADKAKMRSMDAQRVSIEVRQYVEKAKKAARVAREYSLETRELVKELYPDFEQPGIKYLQDIVRMMKVTKRRGNNTFETYLNECLACLEGEPLEMDETVSDAANSEGANLLSVDGVVPGKRGSRKGSFRSSFRRSGRHRSPNTAASDPNATPTKSGGTTAAKNEEVITPTKGGKTLAAKPSDEPGVLKTDFIKAQPQKLKISSNVKSAGQPIQIQSVSHIQSNFQSAQPIIVNAGGLAASEVDSMHYESLEPTHSLKTSHVETKAKLSSKPPEEIQTVSIPVPVLHSTSAIPTVPLQNLLNPTLLNDHFNHYGTLPADESGLPPLPPTGHPNNRTVNQSEKKLPGPDPLRSKQRAHDISKQHNRRLERRRTLPSILTCSPVRPYTLIPSHDPEKIKLSEECKHKSGDSSPTVYILEEGIRKRVTPKRETNADQILSKIHALDFKPPQDELTQLPKNYVFESQVELRKDIGEGSLPDVTVCRKLQRDSLMTRGEISLLSHAHRLEQERELERRLQGEIVIQFSDLKDWCQNHKLLIFVLVINATLCVLFILLLTTSPQTSHSPPSSKKS